MSLFAGVELVGRPDLANVRKLDLCILPTIRKMHARGVAVEREYFQDLTLEFETKKKDLRKEIESYIPVSALEEFCAETINIDSPEQISAVLFRHLRIGHGKNLAMTKSGSRISSGKKQLEQLKNDHPILPPILKYREYAKLINTYTEKIPRIAVYNRHTDTWRVYTNFGVTATDTGRLNSSKPINLQNIPFRSDEGKRVRNGFLATPGFKFVSVDFSQIELRVLAHVAREPTMIRVFSNDGDIHVETCIGANELSWDKWLSMCVPGTTMEQALKGKGMTKEQKDLRLPSKTTNFLVVYGGTGPGLQQSLAKDGLLRTVEWCEAFIQKWFGLYPGVQGYMEDQYSRARRYGFIWDLFGRIRLIPEVESIMRQIVQEGLRKAGNMPVQSTAGGIMKLGMAETDVLIESYRLDSRPVEIYPLMSIHDQGIYEVQDGYEEEFAECTQAIWENCCPLKVPVKVDYEIGERWGH